MDNELQAWSHAITILDESEIRVRDLIERRFAPVARLRHVRIKDAETATRMLMAEVASVRMAAFKKAFRFVRSQRGDEPIRDCSLARWAQYLAQEDVRTINTTVRAALAGGLSNTAIARRVVGSMGRNGVDGATEYTRQRVGHLAVAAVKSKRAG